MTKQSGYATKQTGYFWTKQLGLNSKGMTSAELKHRVKLQEWAARIQDCRSSGLSVRAWCRQEEINAATYYRWERELLALAETEPCSSVSAVRFAELPAPKRVPRNVAERSATLHIGNASLDIYPGCDTEQTLTPQQYRWLMEGLKIEQPKAHRPVMGLTAV